ncbi:DUF459 domain-containing protein [uncultured Campylobacter sp.]|uniref:SGNH/GDSL hydrolase family protein n=1 Tax=uncultured Campylobacter sp. TaxID=218934 RepID=UPI0028F0C628|nr:DUF459 domain-containing protein [uncultured Campylobacter sp.]
MRAFFGVFLAFFTLIALFLRPLSNYYEAKYQKDFFITDERAMALSDKFINAAEDGLQSAKSALDKFMRVFWAKFSKPDLKGDRVAMSVATQNQTANLNTQNQQNQTANLNAQNQQNLAANSSAQDEANLTTKDAQISPVVSDLNLDENGSRDTNLASLAQKTAQEDKAQQPKSRAFDIELNENLGVILIGDSIMQGFGWGFENTLKTSKITIKNLAKASTGLTNKKFYDWSEELKNALENLKNPPQNLLILALFGANDAYSYAFEGRALEFGTDAWKQAYEGRIAQIYDIADEYGAQVAWLGMPCMRSEKFDKKMKTLNLIYKDAAQKRGARYIDIGGAICDNGKYLKQGADNKPLRNDDGVHISLNGAKKVAIYVVDKLLKEKNDNF